VVTTNCAIYLWHTKKVLCFFYKIQSFNLEHITKPHVANEDGNIANETRGVQTTTDRRKAPDEEELPQEQIHMSSQKTFLRNEVDNDDV